MKAILFFILFAFSLQAYAQKQKLVAVKNDRGIYVEHKVQPKENWYSVGRIYVISPKEIAAYNGLTMEKGLSIGQVLKVPLNATNFIQTVSAVGVPVYHVVQPKEGLLKVSSNYGISLEVLKKINNLTSDQVNIGQQLIIGYIGANTDQVVTPVQTSDKSVSAAQTPAAAPVEEKSLVVEKPKEDVPKSAEKAVEKVVEPKVIPKEVKPSVSSANNYFATGFDQQSKEGKELKLENPIYGIFKSSSGWQDGKYYVLMNDVVPGTILKLTATASGRFVHAKVLGAVPPGKESEGMVLRMSNAAAAALGIETNAMLSLVWYK